MQHSIIIEVLSIIGAAIADVNGSYMYDRLNNHTMQWQSRIVAVTTAMHTVSIAYTTPTMEREGERGREREGGRERGREGEREGEPSMLHSTWSILALSSELRSLRIYGRISSSLTWSILYNTEFCNSMM